MGGRNSSDTEYYFVTYLINRDFFILYNEVNQNKKEDLEYERTD